MKTAVQASVLVIALAVATHAAWAQPAPETSRIGILAANRDAGVDALIQELNNLGWIEGQNLIIETRWTEAVQERAQPLAAELLIRGVDVVITSGGFYSDAVRQQTVNTPVVFCYHPDPIGAGLGASLAQPGGLFTGLANVSSDLAAKRFQLLMEFVPNTKRLGFLFQRRETVGPTVRVLETAAGQLDVGLSLAEARNAEDYAAAFDLMTNDSVEGYYIFYGSTFKYHSARLVELTQQHRLASIAAFREWPEAGGLMSYGPDQVEMFRRCAWYVDQVLRGADPAELPIEQATNFEFVVNWQTMEKLGLKPTPAARAMITEVIQ